MILFMKHLIRPTRSHIARFARARFALPTHENFQKKSVSQSTRNALKRIEMQKNFYPFDQCAKPKRRSAMKF